MSLKFRETTYTELWGQGYPQETFGQQASEATRTYLVPWESRQQAVLDFLGYSRCQFGTGNNWNNVDTTIGYLARTTPDNHPGYLRPAFPLSDGLPFLWADSVSIEPLGVPLNSQGNADYGNESTLDSNDEPVYNQAKLTVHYSSRLYPILSDDQLAEAAGGVRTGGILDESCLARYIETPLSVAAQYLSLPEGTFVVASPATDINGTDQSANVTAGPVPGAPGKIEGQWDVTMIWRQVPRRMVAAAAIVAPLLGPNEVQNAAIDLAIGRVNSAEFAGYPAGTLLCEPPEFTQWVQADGDIVFDVTFHFKYYQRGWNFLFTKGNTSGKIYSVEVAVGNPSSATYVAPNTPPAEGTMIYDSFPFAYLFYGYDFSAGMTHYP